MRFVGDSLRRWEVARVGVAGSSSSLGRYDGEPRLVCLRGLGFGVASVTRILLDEGFLAIESRAVWEEERLCALRLRLDRAVLCAGEPASSDGVKGC